MRGVPNVEQPQPPEDVLVHQRFIPASRVQWAHDCDTIMMQYGSVSGSVLYPQRHFARSQARSLIRLMVELRLHERWQLCEHVDRREGGYAWSVQYIRRADDAKKPTRGPRA